MIRKHFSGIKTSEKDKIKWRSHEPHRIEAFSDGVFAFAVSLLIISLEVPHSSHELFELMKGFIPFSVCFGAIFFIWFVQYKFFRQYGMHDALTIALNGVLLFLVLFYVYPLKFMASAAAFHGKGYVIANDDFVPLIALYNAGFTCIFTIFTLLYYNAYLKRAELQLTPIETFETKTHIYTYLCISCVGLITTLATLFGGKYAGFSMALYCLMGGIGMVSYFRDKSFHKKFGNAPEVEPHLGEE